MDNKHPFTVHGETPSPLIDMLYPVLPEKVRQVLAYAGHKQELWRCRCQGGGREKIF